MNPSIREYDPMLLSNRSFRLSYSPVTCGWLAGIAIAASVSGVSPASAQVMDQLPPPPNVAFGETLPTATPVPYSGSSSASNRAVAQDAYLVFVNGDSPLMLQQVQAVVPSAGYREHEGHTVIQVGIFQQQKDANQQIAQLESRGIGAGLDRVEVSASEMAPVNAFAANGSSESREVEFGQTTVAVAPTSGIPIPVSQSTSERRSQDDEVDSSANYFVVVPSYNGDVQAMSQYVAQLALGAPSGGVQIGNHLGSHVRVGPFRDRGTAQNWENYLRAFGMDARVHYRN